MSEMRAHRRNICSDIVELFWNDRLGWPHRAKAILEDISPGGACVQTDAMIPVNVDVAVSLRETGFPGKVRYCTLVDGSYFVGLEFAEGNGWLPGNPDPAHILHLNTLEGAQTVMRSA